MELLELITTLLLCMSAGVFFSIALWSVPARYMLKLLRMDSLKIFNCTLCSGFWFCALTMYLYTNNILLSIILAGPGALTAELTDRKLTNV